MPSAVPDALATLSAVLNAIAAGLLLVGRHLARRGRVTAHRRLARWAWPIWMYVSVTGVMIYAILHHANPA